MRIADSKSPKEVIEGDFTCWDKAEYFAKRACEYYSRAPKRSLVYAQLSTTFAILDQRRESE